MLSKRQLFKPASHETVGIAIISNKFQISDLAYKISNRVGARHSVLTKIAVRLPWCLFDNLSKWPFWKPTSAVFVGLAASSWSWLYPYVGEEGQMDRTTKLVVTSRHDRRPAGR